MIYDNTFFLNKPGSTPGMNGSGCIPGATKLELWQPEDPDNWHPNVTGDVMIHVEEWVNFPHSLKTEPDRLSAKVIIDRLSNRVASRFPNARQWFYRPEKLGDEFLYAVAGDAAAIRSCRDFTDRTYALAREGIPSSRIHGVCIDCYDYWHMREVWRKRVMAQAAPWLALKRPILPVLYLRWHYAGTTPEKPVPHAGEIYSESVASDRIKYLLDTFGRVAIHDGYGPSMKYEEYAKWPLREVVESIAGGKK